MPKPELWERLKTALYIKTEEGDDEVVDMHYIFNYFDSNVLEGFVEFVEEENM